MAPRIGVWFYHPQLWYVHGNRVSPKKAIPPPLAPSLKRQVAGFGLVMGGNRSTVRDANGLLVSWCWTLLQVHPPQREEESKRETSSSIPSNPSVKVTRNTSHTIAEIFKHAFDICVLCCPSVTLDLHFADSRKCSNVLLDLKTSSIIS